MDYVDGAHQSSFKEEEEDRLKLAFSIASLDSGDPFADITHLDEDIKDALDWQAQQRSSQHIISMCFIALVCNWMCAISSCRCT